MFFSVTLATAQQLEVIVPLPPGGPVDSIARAIAKELKNSMGIDAVVSNHPGADGIIAGQKFFAKSHIPNKILLSSSGVTVYPKVLKKPNSYFDSIDDYDMIGPIATNPMLIIVNSNSRIKNYKDFIEVAKKEPIMCATSSSAFTFFIRTFAARNNLKIEPVPFKGTIDTLTNLIGGNIECGIDTPIGYIEFAKTGKLTAIALSAEDRSNNVVVPVIPLEFKFENNYAVALNNGMEQSMREKLIPFFQQLRTNAEFRQILNDRGFYMPVVNTNYTAVSKQDYEKLEKIRISLGIEKQ